MPARKPLTEVARARRNPADGFVREPLGDVVGGVGVATDVDRLRLLRQRIDDRLQMRGLVREIGANNVGPRRTGGKGNRRRCSSARS